MPIDLDDDNVYHATITVGEARNLLDLDLGGLSDALDEAQAHVFNGEGDSYLVITIRGQK